MQSVKAIYWIARFPKESWGKSLTEKVLVNTNLFNIYFIDKGIIIK